jgi:phosphoribosyl 1,2-cyclic phosphodiesterase
LLLPRDALEEDPIIYRYMRERVSEIAYLQVGGSYHLGDVAVSAPVQHIHRNVEIYGLNLRTEGGPKTSYIADTRCFPELIDYYRGDVLILNVVRYTKPDGYEFDHLNLADARRLIAGIHPQTAILTHFGMTMIRASPGRSPPGWNR